MLSALLESYTKENEDLKATLAEREATIKNQGMKLL